MQPKYISLIIFVLTTQIANASNDDLFSASGDNCARIEKSLFYDKFDEFNTQFIYQKIFDCLNGNTYSYQNHWVKNIFNKDNTSPNLEQDGKHYALQYFSNIESMNQKIDMLNTYLYTNQLNACNSSNTEKNRKYASDIEKYNISISKYQTQMKSYNTRNSEYQLKLKAATKVKNQLFKYAYDLCMNGGLTNQYGVPVHKIGCSAYAQVYVMTDLIPEYNYRHNDQLKILSTTPEKPPIFPEKPQPPILTSCSTIIKPSHQSNTN